MMLWLRQMLCRHINCAIDLHLEELSHWSWTCYSCGKTRKLK